MRNSLTRDQIAAALRALGLPAGAIVFMHSSMSSIGYVEDGADTIVDAFMDILSPEGTLVVPTFTFAHGNDDNRVFDSARDPSEMGRLTEVTRTRPGRAAELPPAPFRRCLGGARRRDYRQSRAICLGGRWAILEAL